MSRLLHVELLRARKDPLVRLGMVFMFLLGVALAGITCYIEIKEPEYLGTEDVVYIYLLIISLMSAVVCNCLSGQEYCDGAIRNKLIAGYTRTAIYLSNLVINVIVVVCLWLLTFLTETILELLFLHGTQIDISILSATFLGCFLAIVAFCSIFTLIAMAGQNHRTSDAVCFFLTCIMLFVAFYLMMVMAELDDYDEMTERGVYVIVDKDDELYPVIHNRKTFEFIYDLLPSSQIAQYVIKDVKRPERLPLCSAGIIVVTTAFGVFLFRRKNIQ